MTIYCNMKLGDKEYSLRVALVVGKKENKRRKT
jgi:hypothetical protein